MRTQPSSVPNTAGQHLMSESARQVSGLQRQLRATLPVQRALWWWLMVCLFFVTEAEVVTEMCSNLADDLGASSCTEVLDKYGKGFHLTGTLEQPMRFNDIGFDDNMVGLSPGAQNVCMLAAFGNGGVVPLNCVPILGTQADEFNGLPEQHYFGMEGFDCGFNFMPFEVGSTIDWTFPLGNSCISDADLDLGLTSLYCHFQMSCELGSTTTTTGPETTISSTLTITTATITTWTSTWTSVTASTTATSTKITTTFITTAGTTEESSTASTEATTSQSSETSSQSVDSTSQTQTTSPATSTTLTTEISTQTTEGTTVTTSLSTTTTSTTAAPTTTTAGPTTTTAAAATTTAAAATTTAAPTTTTAAPTTTTAAPTTTMSSIATTEAVATTLLLELPTTTTLNDTVNSTRCDDLPQIANSDSLAHCMGFPSGSFCPVTCLENFALAQDDSGGFQFVGNAFQVKDKAEILLCSDGLWQVRGECIPQGAAVTTEPAVQILLRMNLAIEDSEKSSLEWAQENQEALHLAFAKSLEISPSEIRLDLLPAGVRLRRLAQAVAFDVRITWLLGATNSSNSSDVAVQELELLADAQGMSRLGQALQDELNGTDIGNVSLDALSTGVIENYMVPEVSWVLGPWDTSACECGANGALEVAEVTCSRGSWLLCSGIPRPSSERPCRHCLGESTLAFPSWILPTALGVGFCCCGILGACLARHFLRKLISRLFLGPGVDLESGENAAEKANVLSVDSLKSATDPDDMSVIKRLSTIRPTLTRQSSSHSADEEMQAAKTRVIWDLDFKKISAFFSGQRYSSHVTPDPHARSNVQSPSAPPSASPARPSASPACCATSEIDEADLENPVALEPSWVSATDTRIAVPVLSRSQRSQLNACGTPMNKANTTDTERTVKRTIL